MNYLRKLYELLVLGNQKAITGFVLSGLVVFFNTRSINLLPEHLHALETLLEGVIVGAGVWLKANRD